MYFATRSMLCGAILLVSLLPMTAEAGRRSRRACCYYAPAVHCTPCAPAVNATVAPIMAAAPAPAPAAAPEKSLYERLGGEAAVKAVIDDFVGRAAGNPEVNFTRKGTDKAWEATPENVERLKKHLVQLVSMVTGGPQKYEGRDMKAAHLGMKITDAEFNALAGDLKATLDQFKVPAQEQDELLKIVGSTRGDIVEVK